MAVQLPFANGAISQAGIGLTGVGPTSLRAGAAQDVLRGAEPTDDVIREAGRLAVERPGLRRRYLRRTGPS